MVVAVRRRVRRMTEPADDHADTDTDGGHQAGAGDDPALGLLLGRRRIVDLQRRAREVFHHRRRSFKDKVEIGRKLLVLSTEIINITRK